MAFGKVRVPRFLSLGPANEAVNISLGRITFLSSFVARIVVLYPILTMKTCLIKLGLKNENQPKKNALTKGSGKLLFVLPSSKCAKFKVCRKTVHMIEGKKKQFKSLFA